MKARNHLFAVGFHCICIMFTILANMPALLQAQAAPMYSDNAGAGLGSCYSGEPLAAAPGNSVTPILIMENLGTSPNNFSISITYTDGSGWARALPSNGVIPAGGIFADTLEFDAPPGAEMGTVWHCQIEITHEASGSPRIIPVCLDIPYVDWWPTCSVLATTCKRLQVCDNGSLSNNKPDASLDYIDDCDTFNAQTNSHIYLYQGSPIVSWLKPSGDTVRFCQYQPVLQATAIMQIDSLTYPNYTYAISKFATGDGSIGFVAEYYLPKTSDSCKFIIEKLKFVNRNATAINGVMVGEFLDWDVPSDSNIRNGSGYDAARRMVYQFGAEFNADDSTEALCPQKSDQRFASIAAIDLTMEYRNYITLDAATYISQAGPYGSTAPLPAGAMYRLMQNIGSQIYWTTRPESTYVDLATLVTFGKYNLAPNDTIKVAFILATGKAGLADIQSSIDKGRGFARDNNIRISCCAVPGEVNGDNKLNISDAVFLINYIFRDGPPPVCMTQGDTNGDCKVNVSDVVGIIGFIFKGWDRPKCPPENCNYSH